MNRLLLTGCAGFALAAASVTVATGGSNPSTPPIGPPKTALLASHGMQAGDLRPAARTPSGRQLYVARNANATCVTAEDGSGQCAANADVDDGNAFGGEFCRADLPADQVRITGMLPDGAHQVTLHAAPGHDYPAEPSLGVVAFEVPRALVGDDVTVTWLRSDGTPSASVIPQPPLVHTAACG